MPDDRWGMYMHSDGQCAEFGADPLFDVRDRVVLVTGGTSGIGEIIARAFVQRGAVVIVTSRKAEACERVAVDLQQSGRCHAVAANLATNDGIDAVGRFVAGITQKLDVLVNNAGATWGAALGDFPEDGWDKTVDLNLKAPFFLTQALLPMLLRSASEVSPARIINIASIDGLSPPPFDSYAYAASKAGILMLTRHLAKRLAGDHVLVNAIAPGFFKTKMTDGVLRTQEAEVIGGIPLRRLGNASDIEGTVVFLASNASKYLTGTTICCDGGLSGT